MPTGVSVDDFIAGIEPPRRRDECAPMLDLMDRATGLRPQMWGPSIIGYGRYAYTYNSGHFGQSMLTGFSPRKAAMVVYVVVGFAAFSDQLARLGPHTHSVSCLYLKRLDRVDEGVLEDIVTNSVRAMKAKYPGWSPA
jgi:hypothetical protein